jgi:hypothetical protein
VHAARRFAQERKKSADPNQVKLKPTHPLNLVFVLYSLVYLIPIILPFTGIIEYKTGTIAFFAVIVFRAIANLFLNNFLAWYRLKSIPSEYPDLFEENTKTYF